MTQPTPFPLSYCKDRVRADFGKDARKNMGDRIYEALLNEALIVLLDAQDESVPSDRITEKMRAGRAQIIDEMLS